MRSSKKPAGASGRRPVASAHDRECPASEVPNRRDTLKGLGVTLGLGLGGALGLPLSAVLPAFDVSAAPLAYTLKPNKIAEGTWILEGAQEAITSDNGGAIANISILDTSEGAVIIDTGPSKRYGVALEKMARELTGKPVVRAFLTHFHPDHVFGNQAFAKGVIAAPQAVIDGLKLLGEDFASAMYYTAGDWMRGTEVVLPETVIGNETVDIGGRRLTLMVLNGHTDCDLAIVDQTSGIVFGGDLVFLNRAPTTPHADISAWKATLKKLADASASSSLIVPGHGPVSAPTLSIDQTSRWLEMLEESVRGCFERGLTQTEAFNEPLPGWTKDIALARYEFERSVMHLYPKLEAGLLPRVDENP